MGKKLGELFLIKSAKWLKQLFRIKNSVSNDSMYIRKVQGQENFTIDHEILSTIAGACLEYFRTKFFEAKNENAVED